MIAEEDLVEVIREVFAYAHEYIDNLFVVMVESPVITGDSLVSLVRDLGILHKTGIRIIVVPGARERISDVLMRYDIQSDYGNNFRITKPEDMSFVKMAAFDTANRFLTLFSGMQINGIIGNCVGARAKGVVNAVDYLQTGVVEGIDTKFLTSMLDNGNIPILPCIGWNKNGDPYNISSMELAAETAMKMKAQKLIYILSAEGCLKGLPSNITPRKAEEIFQTDIPTDTLACMQSGVASCKGGVKRTHLLDGNHSGAILSEIFSSRGVGVMIHTDSYERIRQMKHKDIPGVLDLMAPLIKKGNLVPRDKNRLADEVDDYIIYGLDDAIHGCAALHTLSEADGEIAAIAVAPGNAGKGIGKELLSYLIKQAKKRRLSRLFALTTVSTDWFLENGFITSSPEALPEERRKLYNPQRNSRVLCLSLIEFI